MHPLMITIKDKRSQWYLEDEEESIISAAQRFKTHHLSGPAAALAIGSRLKRHNRQILAAAARGLGAKGAWGDRGIILGLVHVMGY